VNYPFPKVTRYSFLLVGLLFLWTPLPLQAEEPVDFARDVIPALTKSGCNTGPCHGAFHGRGGFALSLLGFDPQADYQTIVQASRGRRLNLGSPENSLLLLKATGVLAHGGGKRVSIDSPTYRILRDYFVQGCPPPKTDGPRIIALEVKPQNVSLQPGGSVALQVEARWSDGTKRDVTSWALYDAADPHMNEVSSNGVITARRMGKSSVSVRYLGQVASVAVTTPFGTIDPFPDFPVSNFIDELVLSEWRRLGVVPAPLATDSDFVRRAFLDVIGTLPTPEEVRRFLGSSEPDKHRKLIDELLERPEYVDYWGLKWGDLLRAHRRYVGTKGLGSFQAWLRSSLRDNKPLDRLVQELLTSQGNLFANGPVAYYFIDQKPEELAETTAQLFLGVRLQCARCHHHPFEVWGQNDYYGLAAFFTRLEVRENGDKGRFGGMQILRPVNQETRKLQVPTLPRFLGAAQGLELKDGDLRPPLAEWITSKENPFFARNFANRYWAYLTGRGLVEPIDDMRATNPAGNPALLDALAKDFAKHNFDIKHLVRTICGSRVYRLRAEFAVERDKNGSLFTHRVPRRLPAEVLLDAINQVTGTKETFVGIPPGTRAIALPDPTIPSTFLMTFSRPQRISTCECGRESAPDLLQALHLLNDAGLQAKIANPKGRLATLLKQTDNEIAEELYLAAYARRPTAREMQTIMDLIAQAPSRQEGWEDVLWTLLNTPEFSFNH
jgi:hypothetical protein